MSYSPTNNNYLSLKQLSVIFVIKIMFLQQILFCMKSMCTFMSSTFCLSCLSFHLYYSFLFTDAHSWISWGSRNSNFFSLIKILETVSLCYFVTLWYSSLYCHQFVILANISSKCLAIEKVISFNISLWVSINLSFKNIITCFFCVYSNRDYTSSVWVIVVSLKLASYWM